MADTAKNPGKEPKSTKKEQKDGLRSTAHGQSAAAASNNDGFAQDVGATANGKAISDAMGAECSEGGLAQIHEILSKIMEDTATLSTIERTVTAMDVKMNGLVTRVDQVEQRISDLEDAQAQAQRDATRDPVATRAELQALRDTLTGRLAEAEDKLRKNHLRFVGFCEGAEKQDIKELLNRFLSTALGVMPPPGGIEIERAYRIGTLEGQRQAATAGRVKSRTIIACFHSHNDVQQILDQARKKRRILWDDNPVMIFPDYSLETQRKREAFYECKRALHDRKIKFQLNYPARLKIQTANNGSKWFVNPDEAMKYISQRR